MVIDTGLLLMAYGSPERKEDLLPYLSEIYHGGPVPQYAIDENTKKYSRFGGKSPSNGIIRSVAGKLSSRLSGQALVAQGNKYLKPGIGDSMDYLMESGVERVVALPLFPFPSHNVENSYLKPIMEHLDAKEAGVTIEFVNGFHELDSFSGMWKDLVGPFLARPGKTLLLYTAHSLPVSGDGEAQYVAALRESAERISQDLGVRDFQCAFQSRGRYGDRWLGPSVEETVRDARGRYDRILAAPIGFCYDHIEVLYDLDLLFGGLVTGSGMEYQRVPLPNDSEELVTVLAKASGIGEENGKH